MRIALSTLFVVLFFLLNGQLPFTIEEMAPLPESVSNNAVCEGFHNGSSYVYSFTGIDSSLDQSGIHLKAWRYDVANDSWTVLDSVPDTQGKIAASANRIGDIIYLIGGYYVAPNGSETSSSKVHRFRISTNSFLTDGMDIPIAIDDQVQAVWRDSLIYVVTGWSDNTNVPNVQIYNPSSDSWSSGTSVPNNNLYKVFGASGTIIGDTIFYYGGASLGFNFPATFQLRKGVINPNDPTQITWSIDTLDTQLTGYRMAAASIRDSLFFIGGSSTSYNFDAVAYNGSGVVNPNNYIIQVEGPQFEVDSSLTLPMDLRGVAKVSDTELFLVGGIGPNGKQSNKLLKLSWRKQMNVGIQDLGNYKPNLYPNPVSDALTLDVEGEWNLAVYNMKGKLCKKTIMKSIDVSKLDSGVYLLLGEKEDKQFVRKFVKN